MKREVKWWTQRGKNMWHLVNSMYETARYKYPAKKLTVVGVTGTDGKTTTANLIYEMLKRAGVKTGMISTVGVKYINKFEKEVEIEKGLHTTNPDAGVLQPLLAKMVEEGVTHVVLEVTAHGLDQYRVWGCNFKIGVLTNITHEHLDDFMDMVRYRAAKTKLFTQVKWAVLNQDDKSYEFFKSKCKNKCKVVSYKKANVKQVSPALAGDYNLYNIAAATVVADILGVPEKTRLEVVANFDGVPGRREEVKVGQKFKVIVDFAHTPNALEQVLKSFNGRKILVFGCTGERDKTKRPMMGRIAANLADVVVITSDDTRSESQDEICQQITAGIPENLMHKVVKENDRRKAIEIAISKARAGDTVILAGKGHEKTILIGKIERPWNDVQIVKEILQK